MIEVIEKKPNPPIHPRMMQSGRAYRVVEVKKIAGNAERDKSLNRYVALGDIVTGLPRSDVNTYAVLNATKQVLIIEHYLHEFTVVPATEIARIQITIDNTPSAQTKL